ncbi:hypothetical protein MDAP_001881 [Mitosporidium daphniae]|uniref:Uncharacterized protein n=1 Tax=Mitosporidium daphniae TaxID=1485682 RepID=A0A098VMG2_9MICR|nr:uncharacterized protein DI09_7p510 [Mitosporidium daphniae]KGG50272.1 hypothetical protein DI09_7p510 [Mitosporidium daphniae]|eukprot:XP_013236699.1 uncharacterized protein DI09_7p510 [Mitosporidium daphniae]
MIYKLLIAIFVLIAVVSSDTQTGPVTMEDIVAHGFVPYANKNLPACVLTLSKYNMTLGSSLIGFGPSSKLSAHIMTLMEANADQAAKQNFCRNFGRWRKDALKHVVKEDASSTASTAKLLGLGDVLCSAGCVEKVSTAFVVISAIAMLII